MFKHLTKKGQIFLFVLIAAALAGAKVGYDYFFPKLAKDVKVTTKATGLPPLTYDRGSNAPLRKEPSFNEPAHVQGPEIRGAVMAWNGFSAVNYAVGGSTTSVGSLAEELGLNISLSVQNSCSEQANQLYAFAEELASGNPHPTKGVHFINWMGDGVPSYLTGLNERISKDFGEEYVAKVITFAGASFGEDKWMLRKKYEKDARGSLTCTVIRDGDWAVAMVKCQLMGWPVNYDDGTYDPDKVNFIAAPNDDYVDAGKVYLSQTKFKLRLLKNGKYTGRDTTLAVSGVGAWFPVDQQLVEGRGGLVTVASTKDFASQMACAIVMNSKWANDNRELVEKFVEAIGRGGDQIKSHESQLTFATRVNEVVFADQEKTANDWLRAFKSFDLTDDDGNVVNIGGSRAFSLSDAANYTGSNGTTDTYRKIYSTFGEIITQTYPEIMPTYWPYEKAVDWSFLKAAFNKAKKSGLAGQVSEVNYSSSSRGSIVGDASYSIEFNIGSDEIKPSSYPTLQRIINQLSIANNTLVEISGHTDVTGDAGRNLDLSQRRAQSVVNYLRSKDSDLDQNGRITSRGYGSSKLLPNLPENDARHRRVEIKLFKTN